MAGKFALKKAPGLWVTPHVSETRAQSRLTAWSRALIALLIMLGLGVAGWIRSTVIPEGRARRARAAVALGLLLGAIAERVNHARLEAPDAIARARRGLRTLSLGIRRGVVAGVRAFRNAAAWIWRVAIPAVRDSDAVRYLRRRRPEIALYVGVGAVAVAVGWLIGVA